MKILNLYAGIGGNRKLWGDEHEYLLKHNCVYPPLALHILKGAVL